MMRHDGTAISENVMNNVDAVIRKIHHSKKLWKEMKRYSRDSDGDGVSFLMGINSRTGVPYACMARPLIAELYFAYREHFMKTNNMQLKGNKYTNIKITINTQDQELGRVMTNIGDAMIWSGGSHVGGEHEQTGPAPRIVNVWGRPWEFNRKYEHRLLNFEGTRWTVMYFSAARARATQPYALWMMDSVATGGLIPTVDHQEEEVINNTAETEMSVSKQDVKWPPWKDAPRDARGLPLPLQPEDLGPEDKWKVIPVTN